MPLSLHAAYVPSALQMLGTAGHMVDKAEGWCADNNVNEGDMIGERIIEDMLPFTYQVKCVAEHTQGSVEGVRAGVYSPDLNPPPSSFAALRDKLVDRRVPDRKDFRRYAGDDAARVAAWQQAIDAGRWMRDAFAEFAETDDPARFVSTL